MADRLRSPRVFAMAQITWAILGSCLVAYVTWNGIRPAIDLPKWPPTAPIFMLMYVGAALYVGSAIACWKNDKWTARGLTLGGVFMTWSFALLGSLIMSSNAFLGTKVFFDHMPNEIVIAALLHILGNMFFLIALWFVAWND